MKARGITLIAILLGLGAVLPAAAQPEVPEFVCIPTCDVTDTRLLAVTPPGALASLSPGALNITIAIQGGRSDFRLGIFDGDIGARTDPSDPQSRNWDNGVDTLTGRVTYELFEDPDKDGPEAGQLPLGSWTSAQMPNNLWFELETTPGQPIPTAETARADSGNFVLARFRLTAIPADDATRGQRATFAHATADWSQNGWPVAESIADSPKVPPSVVHESTTM